MAEHDRKYETGYGKPPKVNQFQPGRSGNPKGRPKGSQNFKTDLTEELYELVRITENGRTKLATKQRALIKTMYQKALKGDLQAAKILFMSIEKFCSKEEEHNPAESKPLSKADEELLDRMVKNIAATLPIDDDGEDDQ